MSDPAQHGAAAVEMAIAAIFLVLMACGIVDLGRGIFTSIGLRDAAQEGAIYASFEPSDREAIIQRVIQSVEHPELDESDVTIDCTEDGRVSVEVRHELDLITPVIGQMMGGSLDLERSHIGEAFGEMCDDG